MLARCIRMLLVLSAGQLCLAATAPAAEEPAEPQTIAPGLASGLSREEWSALQAAVRRRMAAPGAATAIGDLGGNDILVEPASPDTSFYSVEVDVANSGDVYAMLHRGPISPQQIKIYRSQDRGTTWSLWGQLIAANSGVGDAVSLHIADGTPARLFVAWVSGKEVHVAYSPLGGSGAAWTQQTAMSVSSVPFGYMQNPRLVSDVVDYPSGYFVYLVARYFESDTSSIVFARSTNQGDAWGTHYALGGGPMSTGYAVSPKIAYGGGVIHAVWETAQTSETRTEYRRALNFAGAGLADWDGVVTLTQQALADSSHHRFPFIAASQTSATVVVAVQRAQDAGATPADIITRASADGGATWPAANEVRLLDTARGSLESLPGGGGFAFVGRSTTTQHGILRKSADATPLAWGEAEVFTDRPYAYWDIDGMPWPAGGSMALAWVRSGATADSLFFDAEWRGDPGFPNIEGGGPMPLFAGGITPPALGELDGDGQMEMVFGAADGFIEGFNHDGSALAGWPQFVNGFPDHKPRNATIAISDLDPDGRYEVIAGDNAGAVHVFQNNGATRSGWPQSIANGDVFISVGRLLNSSHRQIVATALGQVFLLEADGNVATGWPQTIDAPLVGPAAIGDVDNDGTNEIVAVGGGQVKIFAPDGTVELNLTIPSTTFSDQPSLADMDADNDLEIALPTTGGIVHFIHHTGTSLAGSWPFVGSSATPVPAVALAYMRGSDVNTMVAEREWTLHMLDDTGVDLSGWPQSTGSGWFIQGGPTVDYVEGTSPDAIIGTRASQGYAWTNFGIPIAGWPVPLTGNCEVSPASADIDQDGDIEVVLVTLSHLHVYDVGNAPHYGPVNATWPMYGHDAERTACLACNGAVYPVGVDPPRPAITALQFAQPFPNPSSGGLTLDFALPHESEVRITMLDVGGRQVGRLLTRRMPAGQHRWTWRSATSGRQFPAGVYYIRLEAAGENVSRRVVLMP